jgi:hypothetical protein
MSNHMNSNCTHSVLNRRSGGTTPSSFYAHIQLSWIYGSPTVISNNVLTGTTRAGIVQDSHCSNIVKFNNVYLGAPFTVTLADKGDETPVHAGGQPA